MNKTTKSISDEPTDAEIRRSQRATLERDRTQPRAAQAFYVADDNKVGILLRNGLEIRIPAQMIQGLQNATPTQIANITLTASGNALHWEDFDTQMSVEGLVAGIFGTEAWMRQIQTAPTAARVHGAAATLGRVGGRTRSAIKAAAVRENGKKGGRPRKVKSES